MESLIDKLGERGFAGGDVATSPSRDDDAFWPEGPSPVGVSEIVDLIARQAKKQATARKIESHWAFLLGGAGNGKSFSARSLLRKLPTNQKSRQSKGPKRKYVSKTDSCTITVINDATIAGKKDYQDNVRIALAEDILLWATQSRKGRSLGFACVNRGIVLEELHSLLKLKRKGLAFSEAVLRWLSGEGTSVFQNQESLPWIAKVDSSPADQWYRQVRLNIDKDRSIVIHALSVDVGSLFDPRPDAKLDLSSDLPIVPALGVAADFRPAGTTRLKSTAGELAEKLLDASLSGAHLSRPENCPLRANLESLKAENVRANWLTTLRGAEVASGRQITYRDFWGLVALSIAGPRTVLRRKPDSASGGVTSEVDALLHTLSVEMEPLKRLEIVSELALRRMHVALFRGEAVPVSDEATAERPPEFPAARGLMLIDPALDISRHSSAVEQAVEHVSLGGMPSEILFGEVPLLKEAWRPFDSLVEQTVLDVLHSDNSSDRLRRRLMTWLSGYLLRACGCYVGGIGHESVIAAWYRCWHAAGMSNPQFPADLNTGLRTLLLPAVSFQANMEPQLTVPAFSSRATPYESADAADGTLVLSVGVNHLRLRPVRKLDRLWIELVSPDSTVAAHSPLDFALLREALACRTGAYGFTESGDQTAPRLERARASMMSTGSHAARHFGLVSGGNILELV